ncbi:ribosomal-protein-alanine acetyltransferase [Weissella oryzae SG25]|uniref:Ribosomal-protein-alanine acetyltransferase n=1 Tax=Weissella oryzae (strain DSM 25784 / JCM 18191 / LMG 30913 / SG25) TaxID=1329250 RepID=A0A069CRH6_WEIOS|nr:ribosomal protein S18-alanine N-acetyltransferase [Weissella oryzae]GAK29989.1 ribosomal-protein-alanine acetyltransferase [Weissella oryzae SG25]
MDLWKKFRNWFTWVSRPLPEIVRDFYQEITVRGRKFVLRPATRDDIAEMILVERLAYAGDEPWAEEIFYDLLSQPHNSLFILLREPETNSLAGYVIASFRPGIKDVHISNITVAPDWQKRGLGTFLLSYVMTVAHQIKFRRVSLEVRVSNQGAVSLYKRLGFEIVRTRTQYYEDNGEDAYDMAQMLGDSNEDVNSELSFKNDRS